MKVGFQGIKGAYSEMAASKMFADSSELKLQPCNSFEDIFKGLDQGTLQYGVIPIENSLAGSIHENYDHLVNYQVWIRDEHFLRVRHSLLAIKGAKLENIKKVYSHPQALGQCAQYLKNLKVEVLPYFDTAGSARFIAESQDPTIAAIAGAHAADDYGIAVLQSSIEDNKQNFTRFFLVEKKNGQSQKKINSEGLKGDGKTSIVFSLKDTPGGLHKSISVFAIRDIGLCKIESRPLKSSPWKYLFYLDIEGYYFDEPVFKAIAHLGELTKMIKVLGSYKADQLGEA